VKGDSKRQKANGNDQERNGVSRVVMVSREPEGERAGAGIGISDFGFRISD
jgi:hypothetical protein